MAGAIIVIDQPTGAGAGVPGVARKDLWLSQQINLSCGTVNSSYSWDLLDKPPGSAAALVGPGTSTPHFTPDLIGTYRIQLITNGGGPGNVQILVARVRFNNVGTLQNRGWSPPGFGEMAPESNYGGNARGWAEEVEFILADLLSGTAPVGPAGGDLGSTYPNPSVLKIHGTSVPVAGVPEIGKYLRVSGAGTAIWDVVSSVLAGDVTGSITANQVHGLTHVTSDLSFTTGADVHIDVTDGTNLYLGANVGTTVFLANAGIETHLRGSLHVQETTTFGDAINSNLSLSTGADASLDVDSHKLLLGPTLATGVDISATGKLTHVKGDLTVDGNVLFGAVKGMLLPLVIPVAGGIQGLQQTGSTTADERGTISFDPSASFAGNSQITRTITLRASLYCALGGSVQTCSLELFNITDNTTVVTISTQNNVVTDVVSATLAVGAGAGQLPNSRKLYGLRLTRTGGSSSDLVSCKSAQLSSAYT